MEVVGVQSVRLAVTNMYQNGSRYLPKDCDQVCASRLRAASLLGAGGLTSQLQHNNSELLLTVPVQTKGDHYVEVGIGGQQFALVLDTDQEGVFVQRKGCEPNNCYNADAPKYDPDQSTTRKEVRESTALVCISLLEGRWPYYVGKNPGCGFAIPNRMFGDFTKEIMSVWDNGQNGMVNLFPFVIGVSQNVGTAIPAVVSGILGLRTGGYTLSPMEQNIFRKRSYSWCLAPWLSPKPGYLVLYDESPLDLSNVPTVVPMVSSSKDKGRNYVSIHSIYIGTSRVDGEKTATLGRAAINTGSPFSRLHASVYLKVRDAWRTELAKGGLEAPVYAHGLGLDTCYAYPEGSEIDVPEMVFLLGRSQQRFVVKDSGNTYTFHVWNDTSQQWERQACWAYLQTPEGSRDPYVIGATQLQSTHVFFNFGGNQVGWLHDQC